MEVSGDGGGVSVLDIKIMLDEIKNKKVLSKNRIVVGEIDKKIIEFLNKKEIEIYSNVYHYKFNTISSNSILANVSNTKLFSAND